MPELPEVETVKNGIAKFIGCAAITGVEIRNRHFRETIADDFEAKILNRKISGYQRIGKYIIIRLDNGSSIVLHLGMSGRVKTFPKCPDQFEKHDHVIIKTDNGCMVFNDPRRFGQLFCIDDQDLATHRCFAKTGIDPFDEKLTGAYLYDQLQKRKTPIKIALLDQKLICGIGNIYASEILYKSRIIPTRGANAVSRDEAEELVKNIRLVLQQAIDKGGSTLHDYHQPDGSMGYFQNFHCVYNRAGQKCPDCTCDAGKSGGIRKIVQGGRSTYYCPVLQK